MNDSIQNSGEELSIVIYDAPLPPKYFRITKRLVKTLFVVVPILFGLLIAIFFFWGLGIRIKETPTPNMPSVMSDDSKIEALQGEIKSLEQSNQELATKLSAIPTTTTAEDPFLLVIKKPYGMQNFLSQNRVNLDQFEMITSSDRMNLKFQIISSTPEQKVTGHVLVFMISDSGVIAYPKDANLYLTQGVKYSLGEPFSVSRLRPTNAEFFIRPIGENVKFAIYIFNREGDLLHIKETETFKVGAKQ